MLEALGFHLTHNKKPLRPPHFITLTSYIMVGVLWPYGKMGKQLRGGWVKHAAARGRTDHGT